MFGLYVPLRACFILFLHCPPTNTHHRAFDEFEAELQLGEMTPKDSMSHIQSVAQAAVASINEPMSGVHAIARAADEAGVPIPEAFEPPAVPLPRDDGRPRLIFVLSDGAMQDRDACRTVVAELGDGYVASVGLWVEKYASGGCLGCEQRWFGAGDGVVSVSAVLPSTHSAVHSGGCWLCCSNHSHRAMHSFLPPPLPPLPCPVYQVGHPHDWPRDPV